MTKRFYLPIILGVLLICSCFSGYVQAGLGDEVLKLARIAIENLNLDARDLVPDVGLTCSPVKGLVNVKLMITPISLKKQAASVKFNGFTKIQATAALEFIGTYDLLVNGKSIRTGDLKMIGEGAVNLSVVGLKARIDDIPLLVLKLADKSGQCPDIDRIAREPGTVKPGGTYHVATKVRANDRGHIAWFLFANNKAAESADPTLKVELGSPEISYRAPLVVRKDAAPDNYFGNVMAAEVVSKTGNALDFSSYDVMFSTGITMITVK